MTRLFIADLFDRKAILIVILRSLLSLISDDDFWRGEAVPIGRTVNAGYAQAERGLESVGLVVDSLSDYLDKKGELASVPGGRDTGASLL